ncbi:phosphoenolpyruvate synthase [archaeon]|jgi:pyruvate, water dikinase|nr:phosphoenolpyruvate synthase [archaeon]MBT3451173.1 phosphoenolpyruvate synthase [archaeon]MBT6869707.1 phosphoenolpyruvate synthase [archaeon]MBT7192636.1 phosphoenolpyruvate synthase [archaeon]MBT7380521.1 phosphoenolpyruvate synthase [archaeon]
MKYIAWFKDLDKDSIPVAGGKGANLGEMFNIGLPVPAGFVVTAQCYLEFTLRTKISSKIFEILNGLNHEDTQDLQKRAKQVQNLITSTPVPEDIKEQIIDSYELLSVDKNHAHEFISSNDVFVAVRSSATAEDLPDASFAGQQATYLNVKGKDKIVDAVRACWASLFTSRAIYYRKKNNFEDKDVLIAVVVQRMVNSQKSGIMFTINPTNNDKSEIIVEAVYGLGETIVGGQVNPNTYIINKSNLDIKSRDVRKQDWGLFRNENGENFKKDIFEKEQKVQTINDKEIIELSRLGKKIEGHYSVPQDIEWAIEGNDVMIVQARAVTTYKEEDKKTDSNVNNVDVNIENSKTENNSNQSDMSKTSKGCGSKILLKGQTASKGLYFGKVKVVHEMSELNKVSTNDILVTNMTSPDMVPAMKKAGAIITNEGGLTCHAAIISREMGIPCVVGTEIATEILQDGQEVTVNATKGLVYLGKVECQDHSNEQNKLNEVHNIERQEIITATEIKLIMDLPDMAERAANSGADGIGLVRLEIMIAEGGIHPAEYIRSGKSQDYVNLLKNGIGKIAKAFEGKPVWVRCSDLRTDEYKNLQGADQEPKETDPMIGWHGIRRLLDNEDILKAEFQAVKELHEEGHKNVGVMIPFVIRSNELRYAKKIMLDVGLEPCQDVDFGVMIETPASCWIIEDLCKEGMSFISFGTNDLTQLTLGIDRNNSKIAKLFDEMHPAVLGEMAKVISVCRKYKVKTSICGQAGSRPEMAEFLVHQGIDSISSNVDAIDEIRKVVARTEKKLLLDAERGN